MLDPELEVLIKVLKVPETEEEKQELDAKKVIKGLLDITDLESEYKKFVLKLVDIKGYGEFDDVHTIAYLPYVVILIKLPFSQFQVIYETLTGKVTKRLSDFKFTAEPSAKTKRKRNFDEDE